jgi:septum formation protein
MRPLSDEQIRNYVDLENPLDCAGSYKIEGLGVSLFERVQTKDPSAIVGLPLMALTQILEKFLFKVI